MDFKELLQIIVEDRDVSYAILIFAALAVGILVWLISRRVYRGDISGLRVTILDQEATIHGQQATIRGQEATIETLEEPIKLSKDMLWSVEFARVALEKNVDELTQNVERLMTGDGPSKEALKQATAATRIALAQLRNAGMNVLEVFYEVPGPASQSPDSVD